MKERMRLHELIDWLTREEGLSESHVRKLARQDVIKGRPFPGDIRKYYLRSQVRRDVLEKQAETYANGK